jgi:hypothetical protein
LLRFGRALKRVGLIVFGAVDHSPFDAGQVEIGRQSIFQLLVRQSHGKLLVHVETPDGRLEMGSGTHTGPETMGEVTARGANEWTWGRHSGWRRRGERLGA